MVMVNDSIYVVWCKNRGDPKIIVNLHITLLLVLYLFIRKGFEPLTQKFNGIFCIECMSTMLYHLL